MQIRKAQFSDLPKIVEIYNQTISSRMVTADTECITVAERLQWFESHTGNRPIFVVETESKLVAWLSFSSFYGRPAYDGCAEMSIYIDSAQRGKGLGKQLMEFAESEAEKLNIHTLLGFIFAHNHPSVSLFEQFGYERWGRLPHIAHMDGQSYTLIIFGKKV